MPSSKAEQIKLTHSALTSRLLELLSYPRELARQITLIDHELFRNITTADILQRVSEGTNKKRKKGDEICQRTTVELFSDRFNQLSSWVVATLIKEESEQDTAYMMVQFIETAKVDDFRYYPTVNESTIL